MFRYGGSRLLRLMRAASSSSSSSQQQQQQQHIAIAKLCRICCCNNHTVQVQVQVHHHFSSFSVPPHNNSLHASVYVAQERDHHLCVEDVSEGDDGACHRDNKKKIAELLVVLDGSWSPSKENELLSFWPISSSTVHAVLKQLAHSMKEDSALRFLSSWATATQLVMEREDIEVIAQTWAEIYGPHKVSSMHHILASSIPNAPEPVWAALITANTKLRRPDHGVTVFMDMKKAGYCKPTHLSYEPLVFALVKCGRVDAALLTTKEMLSAHILPGDKALGALLEALCKTDHTEAALALVQEIEKLVQSSAVNFLQQVYSRLITAVWRTRYKSMALEILNEMKAKGLKPDRHAYTVCVKLLCRNNRFDMAQELVKDMGKENCVPDLSTYTALIHGLNRGGKVKEALDISELMLKKQQDGLPLDTKIYTAILNSLFLAGKVSDAVKTFERMQTEGNVTDIMTYIAMIKNLCAVGHVRQALDIKEGMIRKNLQPDARLYLALSRGLCVGSPHIEDLLHVVQEMRSKRYELPAEVYLTLVTHFCSVGKFDDARVWVKEMINHGHEPTPYLRTTLSSKLGDVFVE